MNHASNLVTFGILGLAVGVASAPPILVFLTAPEASRIRRTVLVASAIIAWLTLSGALAASGFFHEWRALPPRALVILVPTLTLPLWLGLSRMGKAIADGIPTFALIGLHGFRLPLELVMHQAAREETMPMQMSFEGFNFDILTGVLAMTTLVVYWRREVPHAFARAFAVIGTTLLVFIVGLALASLPIISAFGTEPNQMNTWIGDFPFVWLPGALVASAVFFHVILWRKLAARPRVEAERPLRASEDISGGTSRVER